MTIQLVLGWPRKSPGYRTGTGNFLNALIHDFIVIANVYPVRTSHFHGNIEDLAQVLCRMLLLLDGATTISLKIGNRVWKPNRDICTTIGGERGDIKNIQCCLTFLARTAIN